MTPSTSRDASHPAPSHRGAAHDGSCESMDARASDQAAREKLEGLNLTAQASLLDERAASALREQFIAVLGHDLRNPLAAIDGGMRLLRETPLDATAAMLVDMIQGSVTRMAGLIDNVMDFAQGRLGGGLTLDRDAAQPIEPVLRQVVTELQINEPDRLIETDFALTATVNCDRRRVGQLVSNLLGNALTHGAPDKPVSMVAKTANGWFELSVANSGTSIPAAMLDHIFKPFFRGTHRPSRQGLGLGLYISHEIAMAHGGTLEVRSTAPETRFTFRMPLKT
jgi:sigma-B regulation protein RsbU (phosphoserine phosphatase)